jgi:hypothetical protein
MKRRPPSPEQVKLRLLVELAEAVQGEALRRHTTPAQADAHRTIASAYRDQLTTLEILPTVDVLAGMFLGAQLQALSTHATAKANPIAAALQSLIPGATGKDTPDPHVLIVLGLLATDLLEGE